MPVMAKIKPANAVHELFLWLIFRSFVEKKGGIQVERNVRFAFIFVVRIYR